MYLILDHRPCGPYPLKLTQHHLVALEYRVCRLKRRTDLLCRENGHDPHLAIVLGDEVAVFVAVELLMITFN